MSSQLICKADNTLTIDDESNLQHQSNLSDASGLTALEITRIQYIYDKYTYFLKINNYSKLNGLSNPSIFEFKNKIFKDITKFNYYDLETDILIKFFIKHVSIYNLHLMHLFLVLNFKNGSDNLIYLEGMNIISKTINNNTFWRSNFFKLYIENNLVITQNTQFDFLHILAKYANLIFAKINVVDNSIDINKCIIKSIIETPRSPIILAIGLYSDNRTCNLLINYIFTYNKNISPNIVNYINLFFLICILTNTRHDIYNEFIKRYYDEDVSTIKSIETLYNIFKSYNINDPNNKLNIISKVYSLMSEFKSDYYNFKDDLYLIKRFDRNTINAIVNDDIYKTDALYITFDITAEKCLDSISKFMNIM